MRKLIVIAHVSLDGFVAGPKGEFDNFTGADESLKYVCRVIDDADAALFGRKSYQLINSHWPTAAQDPKASADTIKYSAWYNQVQKIVLSKTLQASAKENTRVITKDIAKEINLLKQQSGKSILIFGSPSTVHSLLELNLIDGFYLIVYPVLFGKGIVLFNESDQVRKLKLQKTTQLEFGIITQEYMLEK